MSTDSAKHDVRDFQSRGVSVIFFMLNVIYISWLPEFCFCSRMWWEIVPSFALITGIAMIPTLAGRAWNRAIHDGLPNRLVEGKKPFRKNTFQALLRSPHSHGDGLPQEGHAAQQAQLLADLCQVTNCLPTLVICIMSCSLSGRTSKAMAPSIGATTSTTSIKQLNLPYVPFC